jgi:hypothetical protein
MNQVMEPDIKRIINILKGNYQMFPLGAPVANPGAEIPCPVPESQLKGRLLKVHGPERRAFFPDRVGPSAGAGILVRQVIGGFFNTAAPVEALQNPIIVYLHHIGGIFRIQAKQAVIQYGN